MEQQSEWSKSFTLKEQASILKRTFKFARPFAATFFFAVIFSIALAVINVYMPQILQYLIILLLIKDSFYNLLLF